MNEALFFIHCLAVIAFLFGALSFGKEAVVAFISLCWLMANLFVTKSITLFGMQVTPTDVYTIGAMLGLMIIQEFWGREAAKKCVWINFILLFFVSLQALFQLHYIPGSNDTQQTHFQAILQPSTRLFFASIATYLITQYLEISLFQHLLRTKKGSFLKRALITESIVQIVDTALFSLLGLAGMVPSLLDIIVVSYLIKLLIIATSAPFLAFTTKMYPHDPIQI